MISSNDIARATNSEVAHVALYSDQIFTALAAFGVSDFRAIAGALATVGVENHFQSVMEYAPAGTKDPQAYFESKYGHRTDLGNHPGDGYKYRGGGLCQLTGRNNYAKYSKAAGIDLVAHPEKILDPAVGSKVFAQFFKDHGGDVHAIRGNWRQVRQHFNGGLNSFAEFQVCVYNLLDLLYRYA